MRAAPRPRPRSTAASAGWTAAADLRVSDPPRQHWAYEPHSDLATLAAAYGWGPVTSHPYRDGNKRVAFLAMAIFVGLNGFEIEASQEDVVTTMFAAAAGQLTEANSATGSRAIS
jgi:death-on-curing family protein